MNKDEKSLPSGPLRRIEASRQGFTLMEILIVIALIAVLAIFILANLQNQVAKARDAQRKTNLSKIQKSLEEYYNDNQTYPTSSGTFSDCGGGDLAPYLSKIPCDPTTKDPYVYVTPTLPATAKDGYVICAKLENQADPDVTRIGCNPATGCGWETGYNYCLSSGMLAVRSGFGVSATPTPVGATPTPTPTPTPVGAFQCTWEGVCNHFYPINPNCPHYQTGSCGGNCGNEGNRCPRY